MEIRVLRRWKILRRHGRKRELSSYAIPLSSLPLGSEWYRARIRDEISDSQAAEIEPSTSSRNTISIQRWGGRKQWKILRSGFLQSWFSSPRIMSLSFHINTFKLKTTVGHCDARVVWDRMFRCNGRRPFEFLFRIGLRFWSRSLAKRLGGHRRNAIGTCAFIRKAWNSATSLPIQRLQLKYYLPAWSPPSDAISLLKLSCEAGWMMRDCLNQIFLDKYIIPFSKRIPVWVQSKSE